MTPSTEFPSLMDDGEFLEELEKPEGEPPMPSPSTRPAPERSQAEADAIEPVIPRDVNRWNVHPNPAGTEPEIIVQPPASASVVPAFLTILIGLSVGAAGSAFIFHARVLQIVALFAR